MRHWIRLNSSGVGAELEVLVLESSVLIIMFGMKVVAQAIDGILCIKYSLSVEPPHTRYPQLYRPQRM